MIYLKLFIAYFQIGLFSFGGGYAAMPLIQNIAVEKYHWLTMAEFADLTTIAEMTPGPIAVNSATFIGQKMAGLPGALICTFGCIMPSIIIVLFLAYFYTKYQNLKTVKNILAELRPAVVSLIASAAVSIVLLAFFNTNKIGNLNMNSFRPIEAILFFLSLFLLRKFKFNPIVIIFSVAIIGTCIYHYI